MEKNLSEKFPVAEAYIQLRFAEISEPPEGSLLDNPDDGYILDLTSDRSKMLFCCDLIDEIRDQIYSRNRAAANTYLAESDKRALAYELSELEHALTFLTNTPDLSTKAPVS